MPSAWSGSPIEDSDVRMARDVSFAWGATGTALLCYELWRETEEERWRVRAVRIIRYILNAVATVDLPISLYGGLIGFLWVAAKLGVEVSATDDLLMQFVQRQPETAPFDLIAGLVGLGLYALERPMPLFHAVLKRLERRAVITGQVAKWLTTDNGSARADPRDRRYDLSMSHGIAGVIALLAMAHSETPALAHETGTLLREGLTFLTSTMRGDRPRFPLYLTAEGDAALGRRPAWCYGDLGVAAALASAAASLEDSALADVALQTALACARDSQQISKCRDHSLCHGAAGTSHVFRYLHARLGHPTLLEAADTWLAVALAMRYTGRGFAGFGVLESTVDTWQWKIDPGFLMGASGCALSFLAASSNRHVTWDRLLLLA